MSKIKQNLVKIGGAFILSLLFVQPITKIYVAVFGTGSVGSVLDVTMGGDSLLWNGFLYAFPFFLTLLEFFFKKPLSQRRPYLYIIGFFIFVSLVDSVFLLATVVVIILGALPGTLFNWWKSKNQNVG